MMTAPIISIRSTQRFDREAARQAPALREPAPHEAPAQSAQRVRRTGDATIDSQLALRIQRPGPAIITYSVAAAPPPAAASATDREAQRIRRALSYYASIADVQFVEVAAGGDLRYDASHGAARSPAAAPRPDAS